MFSNKFLKSSSCVVLSASLVSIAQSSGVFAGGNLTEQVPICEGDIKEETATAKVSEKGEEFVQEKAENIMPNGKGTPKDDSECPSKEIKVDSTEEKEEKPSKEENSGRQNKVFSWSRRRFVWACIFLFLHFFLFLFVRPARDKVMIYQKNKSGSLKEQLLKWGKAIEIVVRYYGFGLLSSCERTNKRLGFITEDEMKENLKGHIEDFVNAINNDCFKKYFDIHLVLEAFNIVGKQEDDKQEDDRRGPYGKDQRFVIEKVVQQYQ